MAFGAAFPGVAAAAGFCACLEQVARGADCAGVGWVESVAAGSDVVGVVDLAGVADAGWSSFLALVSVALEDFASKPFPLGTAGGLA